MGQPKPLLTGNVLGIGREDRRFTGIQMPQNPGFMTAGDFAGMVDDVLSRHSLLQLPGSLVTSVRREGTKYAVGYLFGYQRHQLIVDKVVIACGTGPARVPMVGRNGDIEVNVDGTQGHVVGGVEFLSGDWHMPHGANPMGSTVAVYGGSATASWAVEAARMRGMSVVLWFTRPGTGAHAWDPGERFREAFPDGGRNSTVRDECRNIRVVRQLTALSVGPGANNRPGVLLRLKDEGGRIIFRQVDLLVYALGQAHGEEQGIRAILSQEIQQSLVAFYDRGRALGQNAALLAVGTWDKSLMIVGSAMSSVGGFDPRNLDAYRDKPEHVDLVRYTEIAKWLPRAAQPTEGVAMLTAAMEALNDYMPARPTGLVFGHYSPFTWDINFNTSNRNQLAAYLSYTTDLRASAVNLAVALIVRLRALNTFGLTDEEVAAIVLAAGRAPAEILNQDPDEFVDQSPVGALARSYWGMAYPYLPEP
jgi:ribosomal protein S16